MLVVTGEEEIENEETEEYTLIIEEGIGKGTVEVDNEEVAVWPYEETYENDTELTLKAIPEKGWYFEKWGGSISETSQKITIVMDENKSITPHFGRENVLFGYTKNQDGEALEDVEVKVQAYDENWNKIEEFSNTSDENGYFDIPNITEIDYTEEGGVEFYRIDMEKRDEETGVLEYKSRSNSTKIGEELFMLGGRDFYLDEAVKFNVEGVGVPEPLHDMTYLENHTVEKNYHHSLEWMEDTERWAFISDEGDSLTILNSDFSVNTTVDIPVENALGLHHGGNGVFYTTNSSTDPIETFVWKFDLTGDLLESYNITDLSTGRYEKVGGIEHHDGSFYLLGWNETGTVFDRYSATFSFEENVFLDEDDGEGPLMVGDIFRKDGYWYYAADDNIHKRDDEFQKVSYRGHPDNYWWWETPGEVWGIAHDGNDWYIGSRESNNISEVQFTDRGVKTFEYSVRDYLSEERIASSHHDTGGYVSNFSFHGLVDREYLIEMHKEDSALIINQHITDIREQWDEDAQEINITVDMTEEWRRVSGYVDYEGSRDFTNISVVYYEMDERNKADLTGSYNRGRLDEQPDIYEPTEGYYDIAIPHPVEYEETYLLFITAYNESEDQHYGALQDITIEGGEEDRTGFNVSLEPLLGDESDLIAHGVGEEGQDAEVSTALKRFQFVDSTADEMMIPEGYHSEIYMDYTEYWQNSTEVVWIRDSGDHSTNAEEDHFEIPVFGKEGTRANIFVYGFNPMGIRLTEEELSSEEPYSIPVSDFDPDDVLLDKDSQDIEISIFRGESADDPYPEESDVIYSRKDSDINNTRHEIDFANKMLEILGGEMSLRISYGEVAVHYSNVDVSKSGSPDAMFSSEAEIEETFESLWKFGSTGPNIYEKVLLSMPYDESVEENTTLHVRRLFDEEDCEDPIWDVSAGDDITDIEEDPDLRYYREGYLGNEYEAYLNGTGVKCIEDNEDLSQGLGYKDVENQILWAEIPHFSGLGLNVEGEAIEEMLFDVDIISPNEGGEYEEGVEVSVEFTVENIGELQGTQTIVFGVDGIEEDSVEITLEVDEEHTEELIWLAEDEGEYVLSVASEDEEDTVTVKVVDEVITYGLTVNIDGEGAVEVNGEEVDNGWTGTYENGTEIEIVAISDDGWEFEGWVGSDETSEEITITMEENNEITAVFEEEDSIGISIVLGIILAIVIVLIIVGYMMRDSEETDRVDETFEGEKEL